MAEMPDDDLEPLITECPSCHTRFRVLDAQLQRAGGRVRCGACLAVFHGIDHLVAESLPGHDDGNHDDEGLDDLLEELADATASPQRDQPTPPRTPLFAGFEEPADAAPTAELPFQVLDAAPDESVVRPAVVPGLRGTQPPETDAPASASAERTKPQAAVPLPRQENRGQTTLPGKPAASVTVRPNPPVTPSPAAPSPAAPSPVVFGEPRQRRPLVWLAVAAGLVLLAVQVLVYQFEDWAKHEPWRSVYRPLCGLVGCELPAQRDISSLATRNLVVRTHPTEPKALLVSAVIVNRADFAQPFPVLELQFTSVRGTLLASRRFAPDEYLAGDARGMKLMPPRTPVQIELTMDDPGPDAVNYRLEFR